MYHYNVRPWTASLMVGLTRNAIGYPDRLGPTLNKCFLHLDRPIYYGFNSFEYIINVPIGLWTTFNVLAMKTSNNGISLRPIDGVFDCLS